MFRNKINKNENNNLECIRRITDDFIKENNETKFKNIFEHSVKMIDNFIKNNRVKIKCKIHKLYYNLQSLNKFQGFILKFQVQKI